MSLLSDEELMNIWRQSVESRAAFIRHLEAIAKAQDAKSRRELVEWLGPRCKDAITYDGRRFWYITDEDWQALRREVAEP